MQLKFYLNNQLEYYERICYIEMEGKMRDAIASNT